MIFEYIKATTVEELSDILKEENVKPFSGGTDVFVKMRLGAIKPKKLVDTKGVETKKFEYDGNELIIYMNSTYSELQNADFIKDFPILIDIIKTVGSPQIRNRGTMVGNVMNASPAGDFLLSLYLYDAKLVIGPGMKEKDLSEVIKGPGKIDLLPGEFLYAIKIKKIPGYHHYFEKIGRRNAMNISITSIGMLIKLNGDKIEDVKIAYGSVAPTVVRFEDLEAKMRNEKFTLRTFEDFGRIYKERVNPITDVRASAEYRSWLVENLMKKSYYVISEKIQGSEAI